MPGIFGLISTTASPDNGPRAASMASTLTRFPWQTAHSALSADGHAHLGAVLLDSADARAGVWQQLGLLSAFEGELYDPGEAHARLVRRGASFSSDEFGELLARGLWIEGPAFLAALKGYFAAAFWDDDRCRLTLVTDRFGMRPLFWTRLDGGLAFASEIGALLRLPSVGRTLSPEGLGQFFGLGHFFGDATLFDGIRMLQAGSTLVYDARADTVHVEPFTTLVATPVESSDQREVMDEVARRMSVAVERRVAGTANLGLSLSGGLDARTVLALVPDGVPLRTVSLGVPGSIDHRAAARLSEIAYREHHALSLDQGFLARFEEHLRDMVRLTDGHYLDQGIVMTTLPVYRELGIRTLLRGHAGELMHMRKAYAFSMDDEALALRDREAVSAWLMRHLTDYMIGAVEGPLLAPRFGADVRDIARSAIAHALAEIPETAPACQQIWHLFVRERMRRETAASLHMFRSFVEVRVPFLDDDLVPLLLGLPPHLKLGDTLQTHILRRSKPEFLEVVNANTGAPMGAGPLRTRAAYLQMKVFAKLGVPGYQPYERLGLWLATDLKELVTRQLLSDAFLDRGVFVPDQVRRIVAQHATREKNHTFLIMAMLIFAMGQNELQPH